MKFAGCIKLEGIGTPLKREKFEFSATMRKTGGVSIKNCFFQEKRKYF